MSTLEKLLARLILNQEQVIRYYLTFTLGLILLGLLVMAAVAILSRLIVADAFKVLFGLGGGFVAALSVFPYREIAQRRNSIQTLQTFKEILNSLGESPETIEMEERKKIEDMIWQAIEKSL